MHPDLVCRELWDSSLHVNSLAALCFERPLNLRVMNPPQNPDAADAIVDTVHSIRVTCVPMAQNPHSNHWCEPHEHACGRRLLEMHERVAEDPGRRKEMKSLTMCIQGAPHCGFSHARQGALCFS